ncbi:MAG: flagellar assembly peptidoglycan hydrolase FlgJ [Gammaproteobacteria bacterium]|nr:MAG: flagellar assembly peptidoglycan hydrolase FlgJ [Gammaproteobacteria bacterium]
MEPVSGFQDVYTDLQGLSRLRLAARAEDPEAVGEVARQFEGLFVQMMLREMRKGGIGDSLFGSHQMQMYQEMYDQQIALEVTRNGGIGLAAVIERQLSQQSGFGSSHSPEKGVQRAVPLPATRAFGVPAGRNPAPLHAVPERPQVAPGGTATWEPLPDRFSSPEQFVDALLPLAEAAGRRLGVEPRLLLAQAALETGWGSRLIRDAAGGNSHNLFGIKAGADWDGRRVGVASLEYRDGRPQREVSEFRAYGSYAESFADYVGFVRTRPWYREALAGAADPATYIRALQAAGYATDPAYADKVLALYGHPSIRNRDGTRQMILAHER